MTIYQIIFIIGVVIYCFAKGYVSYIDVKSKIERKTEMNSELFYDIRHLKDFKKRCNQENTIWSMTLKNDNILIYDQFERQVMLLPNDVTLAQYILDLHNFSNRMIKEIEK